MNLLLHHDNFARMMLTGGRVERWLRARAEEMQSLTAETHDPNISIVIRTRNDGEHIRRLIGDIGKQIYDGAIEIVVVDTASSDDTTTYVKMQGAKVINISQEEFTYPKALNVGFQATTHEWVVTLVGHSSLTNRMMLKSLSYWCAQQPEKLGGIYGVPLANWNASRRERFEGALIAKVWREPTVTQKQSMGIMGANCSIIKRSVWKQLGHYDEQFAGGGEDAALARDMLARGFVIVREPLCSVYHSHGLSFANSIRQYAHWVHVSKNSQTFETARVHKRRPDLR